MKDAQSFSKEDEQESKKPEQMHRIHPDPKRSETKSPRPLDVHLPMVSSLAVPIGVVRSFPTIMPAASYSGPC